ncbi:O-methyltransferase [Viscerimonas tarda]
MPRIYRISKPGIRIFYKIRHHHGHGIHSPFVYNLIVNVIEEKAPFYAYQEIKDYLSIHSKVKKRTSKSNLLSFRLANYFGSKNILEIGSGYGINTLCLTAPSSGSKCICVELSHTKTEISKELYKNWNRAIILYTDKLPPITEKQDCICLDLRNYPANFEELKHYLFGNITDNSFIIIKGIRTNRGHQLLWKSLIEDNKVRVSLDLFHEGILFFDPKLYKRNYKLSF